jgi:hypothetical protein
MPNSQQCPPLIDILGLLGVMYSAFVGELTSVDYNLIFLELAARSAQQDAEPFTTEYLIAYLKRTEIWDLRGEGILSIVEGDELDSFAGIVTTTDWVCKRINVRTGLSIDEIRRVIERLGQKKPLDFVYGETDCDMNYIAPALNALDQCQTTRGIWQNVLARCSLIRRNVDKQRNTKDEPKQQRGRPRIHEDKKNQRKDLAARWERFRDSKCWQGKDGKPKRQFCDQERITLRELESALRRSRD